VKENLEAESKYKLRTFHLKFVRIRVRFICIGGDALMVYNLLL